VELDLSGYAGRADALPDGLSVSDDDTSDEDDDEEEEEEEQVKFLKYHLTNRCAV